jgi:hypothetical protein
VLDRPLVMRHPKAKPEDDHFMLDRWTPPVMHSVSVVYREVKDREQRVIEKVFRSVCLCGWRSLEFHKPADDRCPVGEALLERERRKRKDGERVTWLQHS